MLDVGGGAAPRGITAIPEERSELDAQPLASATGKAIQSKFFHFQFVITLFCCSSQLLHVTELKNPRVESFSSGGFCGGEAPTFSHQFEPLPQSDAMGSSPFPACF